MGATINDVAGASGVSISTVSRVFSSSTYASARTRERVLTAARELGYLPNRVARSPIGDRVGTLGCVLPDLLNPFFPQLAVAVLREAQRAGYSVLLSELDTASTGGSQPFLDLAGQTDGLILWAPSIEPDLLGEITDRGAVVTLNGPGDHRPNVILHGAGSMAPVMEYLAALGHRRVCHVARRPSLSWSIDLRAEAAAAAAATYHIELSVIESAGGSVEAARHATELIIAQGATAVVAENDVAAFGVIGQLHERGVRVPEDISVVGFDDTPLASLFLPALTTVTIPVEQVAHAAVTRLAALLRGPAGGERPASIEIPAHLVVRNSTGHAMARPRTTRSAR